MSRQGGLKQTLRDVFTSKSGFAALLILVGILSISGAAQFYIPYEVVDKWNSPQFWQGLPQLAAPAWSGFLSGKTLPQTILLKETDFTKYSYVVQQIGVKYITLIGQFNYAYDGFPSELAAIITARYDSDKPLMNIRLERPDGSNATLVSGAINNPTNYLYLSFEGEVKARVLDFAETMGSNELRAVYPEIILFGEKGQNMGDESKSSVLKGTYRVRIDVTTTGLSDDIDAEFRVYGQVYGLAGTDNKRRDLLVGLVWGAPVALAFGLSAAIVTSVFQALMGSLSAWYGGIIDEITQRITDVYMILPFLPILITVSVVYRIDLLTLLLMVVLLSLLGGMTKTARSMTLQVMTEQYIEAARSYGASRSRILLFYIMPRLVPYIVANIVLAVPAFVFLEAAMSLLGLGDPRIPTWGKMIGDAYSGGAAVHGLWWWIILPSALIILTAAAFAFLGYALDRVVNPRLRER